MLVAISRAPGARVDAAPAIRGGKSPADIPIVANLRWQIYVNPSRLKQAKLSLPSDIQHKGIQARVP